MYKVVIKYLKRLIPDKMYLEIQYYRCFHKKLNLKNPQSFNEKLNWLKLYDHNEDYIKMVDKYEVKRYVSNLIGEEYVIPTIKVWDCVEEINDRELPRQFVLKCTHDSGSIVICRDKETFNLKNAKQILKSGLKTNGYWFGREWPYKNVIPRIIAEEYIEEKNKKELTDYKVLCFGGEPKLIEVHNGRYTNHHTQDMYDINWNKTEITQGDVSENLIEKPINFEKMIEFSKILSKNIRHIRVDWYEVNGKLYFGELTFYDGSGFEGFDNYEDDLLLGSWISL